MKVLIFKSKSTKNATPEELEEIKRYYGVDDIETDGALDAIFDLLDDQDKLPINENKK